MTTKLFTDWNYDKRPDHGFVGINKGFDFKAPHIIHDIQGQHDRLHENQLAHGYRFPSMTSDEGARHPFKVWAGSESPHITDFWLNQHNYMDDVASARVRDIAHALDNELAKAPPLPEHVFAYSGIGQNFGAVLSKVKRGTTYKNPAPLSTSLSPGVAFGKAHGPIISISMRKGSKPGMYIGKMGHAFEHETELVLKRNAPLKLAGKSQYRPYSADTHKQPFDVYHFEYNP